MQPSGRKGGLRNECGRRCTARCRRTIRGLAGGRGCGSRRCVDSRWWRRKRGDWLCLGWRGVCRERLGPEFPTQHRRMEELEIEIRAVENREHAGQSREGARGDPAQSTPAGRLDIVRPQDGRCLRRGGRRSRERFEALGEGVAASSRPRTGPLLRGLARARWRFSSSGVSALGSEGSALSVRSGLGACSPATVSAGAGVPVSRFLAAFCRAWSNKLMGYGRSGPLPEGTSADASAPRCPEMDSLRALGG